MYICNHSIILKIGMKKKKLSIITVLLFFVAFVSACECEEPDAIKKAKLPIEYMAEFNVNKRATNFAQSHSWKDYAYLSYYDAERTYIKGYHLPTAEEMNGVLPMPKRIYKGSDDDVYPKLYFGKLKKTEMSPFVIRDNEEIVNINGERKIFSALYAIMGESLNRKVVYALRLWNPKGDYFSAYRYELISQNDDAKLDNSNDYLLKIQARFITPDDDIKFSEWSLRSICNDDFWDKNEQNDIIRYLPNCSYVDKSSSSMNEPENLGENARYWLRSSSETNFREWRYLDFNKERCTMSFEELNSLMPIRLFADK